MGNSLQKISVWSYIHDLVRRYFCIIGAPDRVLSRPSLHRFFFLLYEDE